jgi:uncharacterized membrane protein YkvA (DUF1232 family)
VIPEDLHGPCGYVDDIFLRAFLADRIQEEVGDKILIENWDGEALLIELIEDILDSEAELIGEERSRLLSHIGYEQLINQS